MVKQYKLNVISILGDPGAVSRVDKMSVVKVYCKIETSPWALKGRLHDRAKMARIRQKLERFQ